MSMMPAGIPNVNTNATSGAKSPVEQTTQSGSSGAGNRGFSLNVAFPGSNLSASADINPPAFDTRKPQQIFLWAVVGIIALVLLKRFVKLS